MNRETCKKCLFSDGYKTNDCISCLERVANGKGIVVDIKGLDITFANDMIKRRV